MAEDAHDSEREFSVCVFYPGGGHEYVDRWLTVAEAVHTARDYTRPERPGVILGVIQRVIITDGGDCIVFEWKRDRGVTFPPEAAGKV